MLLPSASSNPANMISQALAVYKSLINNTPSKGPDGTSSPVLLGDVQSEAPSQESVDDSSWTSIEDERVRSRENGFSLQSPKKGK